MEDNTPTEAAPPQQSASPPSPESPESPPPPRDDERSSAPVSSLQSRKMNRVLGILNIVCFILSLPLLGGGISLLYMRNYNCEELLRAPEMRLGVGLALMLIFVISNLVLYYGSRCPMPALLAVILPLMIIFILGFALVGAYQIESRAVPNSPMWLKLRVDQNLYWDNIKACLDRTQICPDLGFRTIGQTSYQFSKEKLSRIEYVNATCWINTRKSKDYDQLNYATTSIMGGDCETWDNAQNKLCYDCGACKHGFRKTLEQRWKRMGVFLIIMALLLMNNHVLIFVAHVANKRKAPAF
ncbi:hypothetical protein H6P81_000571 [Aristolochia fimbriata]|uniref:Tetraspanin n=1 Tax=Aristolochia fimbriata TaxID=158543 RepID=A0AAV7F911_ARIFI|nr:hypothetical protein H6P81_000571 [Aristolochia fimbriata]